MLRHKCLHRVFIKIALMYKEFVAFILAKTEVERPFGSHVFNLVYLICFIFHCQFCNLQCKPFD